MRGLDRRLEIVEQEDAHQRVATDCLTQDMSRDDLIALVRQRMADLLSRYSIPEARRHLQHSRSCLDVLDIFERE